MSKLNIKIWLTMIGTNWIHLIGFLIAYYLLIVFKIIFGENHVTTFNDILIIILFGPIFLLTYGLIPLICFYIIISIQDLLFFINKKININFIFFFQVITLVPFPIIWAINYDYIL